MCIGNWYLIYCDNNNKNVNNNKWFLSHGNLVYTQIKKGTVCTAYMYISLSWYPQSLHYLRGTQNVAKPCFLFWERNVVAAGSEPASVENAIVIAGRVAGFKQVQASHNCCSSVVNVSHTAHVHNPHGHYQYIIYY